LILSKLNEPYITLLLSLHPVQKWRRACLALRLRQCVLAYREIARGGLVGVDGVYVKNVANSAGKNLTWAF